MYHHFDRHMHRRCNFHKNMHSHWHFYGFLSFFPLNKDVFSCACMKIHTAHHRTLLRVHKRSHLIHKRSCTFTNVHIRLDARSQTFTFASMCIHKPSHLIHKRSCTFTNVHIRLDARSQNVHIRLDVHSQTFTFHSQTFIHVHKRLLLT